jgi:hypothetical protein
VEWGCLPSTGSTLFSLAITRKFSTSVVARSRGHAAYFATSQRQVTMPVNYNFCHGLNILCKLSSRSPPLPLPRTVSIRRFPAKRMFSFSTSVEKSQKTPTNALSSDYCTLSRSPSAKHDKGLLSSPRALRRVRTRCGRSKRIQSSVTSTTIKIDSL